MRTRDLRMVPVAAAAWVSAGIATAWPDAAPALTAALWAVAAVGAILVTMMAMALRAVAPAVRAVLALVVIGTAAAAGAGTTVTAALPARQEVAALATGGGRAISVEATVVGKAERTARGDIAFDAIVHVVRIGTQTHAVDAPARIRGDARPDVGAVVVAEGTAAPAWAGQRAVLVVTASGGIDVIRAPDGVLAVAAGLRHSLQEAVKGLPQPAAGLIPGVAVGDTGGVGPELDAAMKASSLSHLTAVSGANCAIVVGIAFAAAAACRARRAVRVGVGLVALAGFVVLVTPEPSVVRAAAMAAIAMLGLLLGRTRAGTAMLCLAVTTVLIADPWLAGSLGFALSSAATAALLLLAPPLVRGLSRVLPRPLALAVAVPLAAQLACGPLLILVNPTVPLYGVIANMLAAPAAPLATVLGLAACLAAPIPALAAGLASLAWAPCAWIAATAAVAVSAPAAAVPWPADWPGAVALAAVGAAVVLVVMQRHPRPFVRALQAASVGSLAVLAGLAAGSLAVVTVVAPATTPRDWAVAACDIGQGDAILLRSEGAVALVDTGPDPEPLRACLRRFGVSRIDLLVLTHYDQDHIGGLAAVAAITGTALHGPPAGDADRRTLARLEEAGARVVAAHAGMSGSLGDARWSVLWPPEHSRAFPTGNPASLVLDVRGPAMPATLLLGDLDATAQQALSRSGVLHPPYPVVKVAHHGSADQDPDLYRGLGAAVALISAGAGNDYGHPRAVTLTFLHAAGCTVLRTDTAGAVAVREVGGEIRVWQDRAPP